MKYNSNKHHRQSIRLQGYDYTSAGSYFITICTHQRECLLGDIVDGEMQLNAVGLFVQACWQRLSFHFAIELDAFIVMPNHLHGILWLGANNGRGEAFGNKIEISTPDPYPNASPLQPCGTQPGSIGAVVQNFKSISTQKLNRISRQPGRKIWQRNYYEHIVRSEESLHQIRQYIHRNPLSWQQDQLYPDNPSK